MGKIYAALGLCAALFFTSVLALATPSFAGGIPIGPLIQTDPGAPAVDPTPGVPALKIMTSPAAGKDGWDGVTSATAGNQCYTASGRLTAGIPMGKNKTCDTPRSLVGSAGGSSWTGKLTDAIPGTPGSPAVAPTCTQSYASISQGVHQHTGGC